MIRACKHRPGWAHALCEYASLRANNHCKRANTLLQTACKQARGPTIIANKPSIDESYCYALFVSLEAPLPSGHISAMEASMCGGQTPPRPPFHQCIIKAVGFFTARKPVRPSKTTILFS